MVFSENCIKVFEVRFIDCNNIAAGDFNGFVTEAPLSCPFLYSSSSSSVGRRLLRQRFRIAAAPLARSFSIEKLSATESAVVRPSETRRLATESI